MSIGSTIKRLRHEHNITQEQLAEYLGITSRAISQWECDRTVPDISQIPILCNILNISADTLLGIDISQKTYRIQESLKEAEKQCSLGYNTEGERILRNAYREFPNSFEVISDLMSCIWKTRNEPERAVEREKLTKEVISLGEKIINECTDDKIRRNAIQILCFTYPELGKQEKAIELAEKMPGRYFTRENLLSSIYRGNDRFDIIRKELIQDISDLYCKMLYNHAPLDNGNPFYSNNEIIEIYEKFFAVMDIFFEDGNFGFYRQIIGWSYINLAALYMQANKFEKALECLKSAKNQSILFDTVYSPDAEYTCLLFRGMKFGEVMHNISENDCLHQLNAMNDHVFDKIRDTLEFKGIENELKKYAQRH